MNHFIRITSAVLFLSVPLSAASEFDTSVLLKKLKTELTSTSSVPVYAPLQLPELISKYGIEGVDIKIRSNGYRLSYYFKGENGDFSPTHSFLFAASISGDTNLINVGEEEHRPMPNTTKVKLTNGTTGTFRPVRCGGSCAPANLWFEIGRYQYNVQIKMSSKTPKTEQLNALLIMANSVTRKF